MSKVYYVKDTQAFWQEHRKARIKLDKKMANLSRSKKMVIEAKMRENHGVMLKANKEA